MREIIDRDEPTTREVWDREKAIEHFKKKGELYKAEIINSTMLNSKRRQEWTAQNGSLTIA